MTVVKRGKISLLTKRKFTITGEYRSNGKTGEIELLQLPKIIRAPKAHLEGSTILRAGSNYSLEFQEIKSVDRVLLLRASDELHNIAQVTHVDFPKPEVPLRPLLHISKLLEDIDIETFGTFLSLYILDNT